MLTRVDENVLAVPDDAVSTLAGVSTVYVIENGKARQQQVTLGARQNKLVEIVDGSQRRRDAGDVATEPARDRQSGAHRPARRRCSGGGRPARPWPRAGRARSARRPMMIADVSVKRPVFAIMMTAALIVLGAFSYRTLGLDLMPKTDAPVVTVHVNLPGASAEEIETQITKRDRGGGQHDQRHRRAARHLRSGQLARHASRSPSNATSNRRRRTCATRSRTIVGQFPRDTRPPQIQKIDPDAAADPELRGLRPARAEGAHRDRRQARQAGSRDAVKDVGSVELQRRAQARDPAAAERRPAERLRADRRPGAHRGRAPERRESRAAASSPGRPKSRCARWAGSRTSTTSTASSSPTARRLGHHVRRRRPRPGHASRRSAARPGSP